MQRKLAIVSALPFCLLPLAALAQGPTVNFGIDLTSNYVDEGATVSNNQPAIQPHIEISSGNLYGGLWFSNIAPGPDTLETDVYLGVTGDIAGSSGLSYDIKYTRVYFNSTGDQGGTLESAFSYAPSDNSEFGITVKNDLAGGPFGLEFSADHTFANDIGLGIEVGKSLSAGSATYWTVALSKDLSEKTSVELAYHDTDMSTPLYTLTMSWATDILTNRVE